MASPTPTVYTAPSNGAIYGGRSAPRFSGTAVLAGDSLTALTYPSAPYRWWLPLIGSPVKAIYNAGITNNTMADLWARWSTDVAAKNSDGVILRIGTNNGGLDKAGFKAQYKNFTDWMLSNGKWGVLNAIPPRSGSGGPTIMLYNDAIAELAAASGGRLKFCDDGWVLSVDSNYTYNPDCFIDGIHHNPHGQYLSGVSAAALSAGWFEPVDPRIKSASDTYYINSASDQYVKNPMMQGTGGTMYQTTGVVVTDWAVNANGGGTTAVCSIVAADAGDTNQTPWQRVAPSFGGGGHIVGVGATLAHPAIASDMNTVKRFDAICEIRMNLDTTNLSSLIYGVTDASVSVGATETIGLAGNGVIAKTLLARVAYARDQNSPSRAHAANSLAFGLSINSGGSTGNIGYIDFRLASVRAQGA